MTSDKVSQHAGTSVEQHAACPSRPSSMMFQNILSRFDIPTVPVYLFPSLIVTH